MSQAARRVWLTQKQESKKSLIKFAAVSRISKPTLYSKEAAQVLPDEAIGRRQKKSAVKNSLSKQKELMV